MYLQNLQSSLFIRQTNFNMYLKSTWSQNSFINQILSVCHSNNENIIQRLHTINVCQQLIYNLITNLRPCISRHSSLLAYGINFIKHDNMQWTLIPKFLLISSCLGEKFSNVFFTLSDISTEYLWSVDYF